MTPSAPDPSERAPKPALLPRAEATGLFERHLVRARARGLSISHYRPGRLPPELMSSQAMDWMLSCQRASELLASCPGRPEQRSIPARIPRASIKAEAAGRLASLALRSGSALLFAPEAIGQALARARGLPKPEPSLFGPLSGRAALKALRRELSAGPNAIFQGAYQHASQPPLTDPLSHGLNEVEIRLPAPSRVDRSFHQRLLGDRGWGVDEIRVFIALHEAAHATHALQSESFELLFGLHWAGAAREALAALIWTPTAEPGQELSPWEDNCAPASSPTHPRAASFTDFEFAFKNVLLEGYADCFASLALAQTQAKEAARIGRDWIDLRAQRVPNRPEGWEGHPRSDLLHDSREALRELCALCESQGEGPLPLPDGGLHELALRCALAGAARWTLLLAQRSEPGPIASSFWRKLEALAELGPPAPSGLPPRAEPESALLATALGALASDLAAPAPPAPGELIAEPLRLARARALRLAAAPALLAPILAEFGPPKGRLEGWLPPFSPPPPRMERLSQLARSIARRLRPKAPALPGAEPAMALAAPAPTRQRPSGF